MFISRDPVSNRGNEINVTTYYKIKNIVAVFGFGFLPRICLSKWHRFQNVILAAGIYQSTCFVENRSSQGYIKILALAKNVVCLKRMLK